MGNCLTELDSSKSLCERTFGRQMEEEEYLHRSCTNANNDGLRCDNSERVFISLSNDLKRLFGAKYRKLWFEEDFQFFIPTDNEFGFLVVNFIQ